IRRICYTKKRIFLLKRGSFKVAKKRKRKTSKKNQKSLKNIIRYEIIGLLFILIAIFSSVATLFSDGFIPSILDYSLRFFLGMWYFIGSLVLFIMGLSLIFKKQFPKLLTRNNISMLILFLGGLLLTHIYILEIGRAHV